MPFDDADDLTTLARRVDLPEAALLRALAGRIAALLGDDPDRLRHALYRIDVPEGAARTAAGMPEPALALARLVLARVQEKAALRAAYTPPPPADDAELAW